MTLPACSHTIDSIQFDVSRTWTFRAASGALTTVHFSCPVWARRYDADQWAAEIARDRSRAVQLEAAGKTWRAKNLRTSADEREARIARILARWHADPVACSA